MIKFVLLLLPVTLLACAGSDPVPTNAMLWRVEGWQRPPAGARQDVRVSRATILGFRKNGEYVEVHCSVIEQPDQTVLIQSGRPCVSAVGRWEQRGGTVTATRQHASAAALCTQPQVTFRVTGNSVSGNVTGAGEAAYTPVTRFVAPEFETHVEKAREGSACGGMGREEG